MKVLEKTTGTTQSGTEYTISIVQTSGNIRPAKHTSLQEIRKMADKPKQNWFQRLGLFK